MAKKPRADKQTEQLKTEIARSREYVARDLRGLRYEMDVGRKIRRSFRRRPVAWVGAAIAVGTLLVLLPLRKKTIYVDASGTTKAKPRSKLLEAGFVAGAVRIALTMLKPAITRFVVKKISRYGERRATAARW